MVIDDEVRNAAVDAAAARVNGGTKRYKEGSTTRLTFSLKSPAFLPASGGSAQLDVTSPTMSATAASSATTALDNYEICNSSGAVKFSGDIGAVDSGAEVEMNHPDVQVGDVATVDDFVITMPAEP